MFVEKFFQRGKDLVGGQCKTLAFVYLYYEQERVRVLVYYSQHVAIIEWTSNPVSDMFADAALAAILHAQTNPVPDKSEFTICFL